MPRQPQIVVSLVANDPAAGLTKRSIAMDLTIAWPFRKIEESGSESGCWLGTSDDVSSSLEQKAPSRQKGACD
jgi:hypothetical protein